MIYLSLGSNLGNRGLNLRKACNIIKNEVLTNFKFSNFIETDAILPMGYLKEWDRPYLNMIVSGTTTLSPLDLLNKVKHIENILGRKNMEAKWSPRVIDIDILFYNDLKISSEKLTIPHKEISNRPFLCYLLETIDPGLKRLYPFLISCLQKNYHDMQYRQIFSFKPNIVGIINCTDDSFSETNDCKNITSIIKKIGQLIDKGASIIDIGAEATNPQSTRLSEDKEYNILYNILHQLQSNKYFTNIPISLDCYKPRIVSRLIKKFNIHYINDVTGQINDIVIQEMLKYNIQYICMHSLGIPPNKQNILNINENSIDILLKFFQKRISRLLELGFDKDDIILDPGVSFGKTWFQNIEIIKNISALSSLGCKIMIGHSRKGFLRYLSATQEKLLDIETLAISNLVKDKVEYLRIHNLDYHNRFFNISYE